MATRVGTRSGGGSAPVVPAVGAKKDKAPTKKAAKRRKITIQEEKENDDDDNDDDEEEEEEVELEAARAPKAARAKRTETLREENVRLKAQNAELNAQLDADELNTRTGVKASGSGPGGRTKEDAIVVTAGARKRGRAKGGADDEEDDGNEGVSKGW